MYLEDKIDELFEMYHKYFSKQSKTFFKKIANNESSINYRNLSYKILLVNGVFREFNFFKRYGSLYSLLKNLVTRKMTINSANADQISFIIDLIHGYDESKLTDIETIKNEFFYNTVLIKAKNVFLDTKENPKKGASKKFPSKEI